MSGKNSVIDVMGTAVLWIEGFVAALLVLLATAFIIGAVNFPVFVF